MQAIMGLINTNKSVNDTLGYSTNNYPIIYSDATHHTFNNPDISNPVVSDALNKLHNRVIPAIEFSEKNEAQVFDPEIMFYPGIKDELCEYIHTHYLNKQQADIIIDQVTNVRNTNTWLHTASLYGLEDILQFLTEHGGQKYINARNDMGETPLFEALRGEYVNVMKLLIKAGANLDIKSNNNCTPLELAMILGKHVAMSTIITAGANLDLQDDFGNTLLHKAVLDEDVIVVGILVKAGANINVINSAGFTPLQCANSSYNDEIKEIFNNLNIEYPSSTVTPIIETTKIDIQSNLDDCIDKRVQEEQGYKVVLPVGAAVTAGIGFMVVLAKMLYSKCTGTTQSDTSACYMQTYDLEKAEESVDTHTPMLGESIVLEHL